MGSELLRTGETSLTILVTAGRITPQRMKRLLDQILKYGLEMSITLTQDIRLNKVPSAQEQEIRESLTRAGFSLKEPGNISLSRVCMGGPHCRLGQVDTEKISRAIVERFSEREDTKSAFKIAVSGCNNGCSGTRITDIGIEATGTGFDLYVGGKGGASPQAGVMIKKMSLKMRSWQPSRSLSVSMTAKVRRSRKCTVFSNSLIFRLNRFDQDF